MARQTIILDNMVPCVDRLVIGDTGANLTVQPGQFAVKVFNSTADQFVWQRTNATADRDEPVYILTEDSANNVLTQSDYTVSRVEQEFNAASAAANIVADADTMPGVAIKNLSNVLARVAGGQTVAPGAYLTYSDTSGAEGMLEVTTTQADAVAKFMGPDSVTTAANAPQLLEVDLV